MRRLCQCHRLVILPHIFIGIYGQDKSPLTFLRHLVHNGTDDLKNKCLQSEDIKLTLEHVFGYLAYQSPTGIIHLETFYL